MINYKVLEEKLSVGIKKLLALLDQPLLKATENYDEHDEK